MKGGGIDRRTPEQFVQDHLSFLLSLSQSASTLFGLSSDAVEFKGL